MKHEPRFRDHTDSLFGEMKMVEVKMSLNILQAAKQVIFNVAGVEDTRFIASSITKEPSKTSSALSVRGSTFMLLLGQLT